MPVYFKLDMACSAEDAGRILRLSSTELNILKLEVECTTEDPILVLKPNAMWVAAHGQFLADNILDRIARFRMVGNRRRDSGNGQTRWIFHFDHSDDISDCRADVLANHPNAFGIGPVLHGQLVGAGMALGIVNVQPLASAVIIHKLGLRRDETQSYPFFFLFD